MTHTSGLQADPGCFPNPYFISPWEFIFENEKEKYNENKKEERIETNPEKQKSWIAAALQSGMRKPAGEEWAYCSFGFLILGEIISRVSK